MKRRKSKIENSDSKIKLRLDYRTTIIVKSREALDNWLGRYPNAKVIS